MMRWPLLLVLMGGLASAAPYRFVVEDATHPGLPIPPPAATPVEVIVHGRTSSLVSIHIAKVGAKLPPTLAGDKMANTPGFQWYLSRHFALKAQVPRLDEAAMLEMLTIAELAYPHQVHAVGREPVGLDAQRLPIVFAADMDALNAAVKTDLGDTWNGGGGGVTLHANRAAYNYWTSGGLMYHRRDLLIHENTHMVEMCAVGVRHSPVWLLEGLSHTIAQHVWDKANQRLTVAVLDRAPNNNFYERGLLATAEKPVPAQAFYDGSVADPYQPGVYLLWLQFCWADAARAAKWRQWRDGVYALGGRDLIAGNGELMPRVFGPADSLDREWRAWLAARRNSFHWACWGWEQDGDTLQAYGWPPAGFDYAQMDITWAPGERPAEDPLRLDWPHGPAPALVGPVDRAGDEPSYGFLLDFRGEPGKGLCGLAVARAGGAMMPILVRGCRELSIDGAAIGLGVTTTPFPEPLAKAIADAGGRLGLNVRFGRDALTVTVRADGAEPLIVALPVNADQRRALLDGGLSLLSKDANHKLTPYLDLTRRAEPDYDQPAAVGWR